MFRDGDRENLLGADSRETPDNVLKSSTRTHGMENTHSIGSSPLEGLRELAQVASRGIGVSVHVSLSLCSRFHCFLLFVLALFVIIVFFLRKHN